MKALLIFFLLIFPFFVFAQDNKSGAGIISGTISTADGQAAPYVSVWIKNTGKGATTDIKGNFEIKKIKPGNYLLAISLLGYIDSSFAIEIKPNEIITLKVRLKRTYAELQTVLVKARLHPDYVATKPSESLHLNLPLNEIPQNIAVTSKQLLSDQGLLSISEAFRTVSGVQKTDGGLNDFNVSIRGTDATFNVARNGVIGYWFNQQEDVAMLEKIEFIKGPGGFLVSHNEPGGFINAITKQPTKETIANINGGFGSYNMVRLTADFGGMLKKSGKISYRFNAGVHNQERAFQFGKAFRYFICAAANYDLDKKTSITAEYNYMYGRRSGNNSYLPSVNGKMFILPHNFAVADAGTDKLTSTDNYYRIQLKHSFNDNWRLIAQGAYVNGPWGGYMLNADGNVPVSNDTLYRASNFDDFRNFLGTSQVFVDGTFNTGCKVEHKVLFGFDYGHKWFNDQVGGTWGEQKFGLYLPHPQYDVEPDSLKDFQLDPVFKLGFGWAALYTEDHIKIAGKLVITLAGRFEDAFLNTFNNGIPDDEYKPIYNVFTPRFGLTWLFSENVSAYGLYDQSFYPQTGKNFENKPFNPLTGYNIETGMKGYFFDKKLSLGLSAYHIVKNNTLSADPLHPDYQIQRGQISTNGIDFDMTGNITRSLTVNANYEYADAKITKDSDPNMVGVKNFGTPDHYGNLWLKYNLFKGLMKNISFAVGYQYMGKRSALWNWSPGDAINYLPVYNLFDAALNYHNEKFNIGLNVYNITNINYATMGYFNSSTNEWRYTPGEPVNFRISFGFNLLHQKKVSN
jgi:iron complex outermembrane receptor protein